jgi:hypothetical protein
VSTRCVLTESVSTQKLRRDNVKLIFAKSAKDPCKVCVCKPKHIQYHIVQEEQLSCKEPLQGAHSRPSRIKLKEVCRKVCAGSILG